MRPRIRSSRRAPGAGRSGTQLYFTLDLGVMKNVAPGAAIGLTAFGGSRI